MNNQTDNSKPELNIHKLSSFFHPEFKMESFRQNLCRQQAVLELIGKAQAKKDVVSKLEYYTIMERETARKFKMEHYDAVIARLTNYLINLSRKGLSHG